METFHTALMLLAVGMGTVFFILLFIIYFSKGLILLINRFYPDVIVEKSNASDVSSQRADQVSPQVNTIITKAVTTAFRGMKITNITKIK